jgi:transposase
MSARRYELSDFEWSIIEPLLPNEPRGVPRADDRKVLNGIYWRLRTGSPWADIPERYGPATTCYNRFVRWRKLGVWDRIFAAVSAAYDGDLQMVDSSDQRRTNRQARRRRPKSAGERPSGRARNAPRRPAPTARRGACAGRRQPPPVGPGV